jgi:glutaredoxin
MKFTVYTKDACPHCVNAKNMLQQRDIGYNELHLGTDLTREQMLEHFQYFGHGRTMPMVIVEDEFGNVERIGGASELKTYLENM